MRASEAKMVLRDKVAFDIRYCNEHECAEACKLAYEALDLLEKVESMEYQPVWHDDDDWSLGYNACLRELKGDSTMS